MTTGIKQDLITQENIISTLNKEGYNISLRTIQYWRTKGLLPSLIILGREGYYPSYIVNLVKGLCYRYKSFSDYIDEESLGVISLEDVDFNIIRIEVIKQLGITKLVATVDNGNVIVKDINFDLKEFFNG